MKKKVEKLVVFSFSSCLLFVGALIAGFATSYIAFAGSLVGLATAFFAGHVGAAYVDAHAPVQPEQVPPPQGE